MKKKKVIIFFVFLILISFCFSALAETNNTSKIVKPVYINMDDYDKRIVIIGEDQTLIIIKKDESKIITKISEVNLDNININDKKLNIEKNIISNGINYKLEKIVNRFAYITLTPTKEEDTKEIPIEEEILEEEEEIEEEEEVLPIEEEVEGTAAKITGAVIETAQELRKSLWSKIIGGIIILFIIIYLLYFIVFRSGAPLQLVKRDHNWYHNRASLMHKRADEFYRKGKRSKAEKLFKKAQSYREKGEQKQR